MENNNDNTTRIEGSPGLTVDPNVNMVSTINELKNNRVAKEDYEKVLQYNKELNDIILNGQQHESENEVIEFNLEEVKGQLFNEDVQLKNLDYWKNALALREYRLKTEGKDIFNASNATENEYQVERLVEGIQYCIDNCDDNPERFNGLLSSIIKGK